MGLVDHNQPVYLYNLALTCNTTKLSNKGMEHAQWCNKGAGIASLVILGMICLVPIIFTIITFCCNYKLTKAQSDEQDVVHSHLYVSISNACKRTTNTKETISKASVIAHILKSLTVCCYLFGNNLDSILHEYGQCLDCDHECVETARDIAKSIVIVSTFLFHAIPPFMKHVAEKKDWKYTPSYKYELLGIFSVILKAQSTYSAIDDIFHSHYHCRAVGHVLGWMLLVATAIIATTNIGLKINSYLEEKTKDEKKSSTETKPTGESPSPQKTVRPENKEESSTPKCKFLAFTIILILILRYFSC